LHQWNPSLCYRTIADWEVDNNFKPNDNATWGMVYSWSIYAPTSSNWRGYLHYSAHDRIRYAILLARNAHLLLATTSVEFISFWKALVVYYKSIFLSCFGSTF